MYSLGAIEIGGSPTVVVGQIVSQQVDPAIEHMIATGSGRVDPTFISMRRGSPRITFASTAIKTLLDNAGIGGLIIDPAAVPPNPITLWWRRRKPGGTYDDTDAVKQVISAGLLYPTTLDAAHGVEPATINYELVPVMDGSNEPIATTKGQAFSVTWPTEEHWGIGPAFVDDMRMDFEQRLRINFGLTVNAISGGGEVWPREVHLRDRQPTIECDSLNMALIDDTHTIGTAIGLGSKGVAIDAVTDTAVFLRKAAPGGTWETDATAVHIRFTLAAGRVTPNAYTGQHGQDASLPVLISGVYDGTNAIMAVNTAAAIAI